ncbi:Protein of unknown function [Pyronema omphalodes CBS 100304]|uniref:Uncharacterized protein n=1 Tax=Pyronema omphalodes (strain CBS 100304) TaxID=1076935 RepID=U4KVG9_PYROM|nr:Protein of unknown function [Pyronema omphalodes CBS 100304]
MSSTADGNPLSYLLSVRNRKTLRDLFIELTMKEQACKPLNNVQEGIRHLVQYVNEEKRVIGFVFWKLSGDNFAKVRYG